MKLIEENSERRKMPFIIIFFIIPLIEIALFIGVGEEIGLLSTLGLCLVTAIIGGGLVRHQGLQTLFKAQTHLRGGALPLTEIFDGFCIVIAGALLLTPGFFTDLIGFSLLVPQLRHLLRHSLSKSRHFTQKTNKTYYRDETIIDAEYETVNQDTDHIENAQKNNEKNN